MKHRTSRRFWSCYEALPPEIQRLADANFQLLKADPKHPSLQFKKVDRFWSVRIGLHYRAMAVEHEGDMLWFWIGTHAQYDHLLSR